MCEGLCGLWEPGGSGFFEAGVQDVAVATFDETGADGQSVVEGAFVVQRVGSIGQITVGVLHRSLWLRGAGRFEVAGKFFDDPSAGGTFETFLLGSPPGLASGGRTGFGCGSQILAGVVEVAKQAMLLTEDFRGLKSDPGGSVGHDMDAGIESPASVAHAVRPSTSGFFHAAEGGPVDGLGAALGLGGYQAHFIPASGAFAFAFTGSNRADHRSIGLGNNGLLALLG